MTTNNQPKVRVGKEVDDLDFLLDQVANGDLSLAFCMTMPNSHAGNLIRAAIDTIQAARHIIRESARNGIAAEQIDFAEVRMANEP